MLYFDIYKEEKKKKMKRILLSMSYFPCWSTVCENVVLIQFDEHKMCVNRRQVFRRHQSWLFIVFFFPLIAQVCI